MAKSFARSCTELHTQTHRKRDYEEKIAFDLSQFFPCCSAILFFASLRTFISFASLCVGASVCECNIYGFRYSLKSEIFFGWWFISCLLECTAPSAEKYKSLAQWIAYICCQKAFVFVLLFFSPSFSFPPLLSLPFAYSPLSFFAFGFSFIYSIAIYFCVSNSNAHTKERIDIKRQKWAKEKGTKWRKTATLTQKKKKKENTNGNPLCVLAQLMANVLQAIRIYVKLIACIFGSV